MNSLSSTLAAYLSPDGVSFLALFSPSESAV